MQFLLWRCVWPLICRMIQFFFIHIQCFYFLSIISFSCSITPTISSISLFIIQLFQSFIPLLCSHSKMIYLFAKFFFYSIVINLFNNIDFYSTLFRFSISFKIFIFSQANFICARSKTLFPWNNFSVRICRHRSYMILYLPSTEIREASGNFANKSKQNSTKIFI